MGRVCLDVATQAQVINLLDESRRRRGLSYLFIGHDLPVVRHICQRVVALLGGRVTEAGPGDTVVASPRHPHPRAPPPRSAGLIRRPR